MLSEGEGICRRVSCSRELGDESSWQNRFRFGESVLSEVGLRNDESNDTQGEGASEPGRQRGTTVNPHRKWRRKNVETADAAPDFIDSARFSFSSHIEIFIIQID